jgi:acetoin utilization deacetylase AcuC-like enzyme
MHEIVYFYPEGHARHREAGHPERPERVETIRTALREAGLWDGYPHLQPMELLPGVLETVHAPAYLEQLKAASRRGQHLDADTYVTPDSWELALNSAGGAVSVAAAVWHEKARRGFALCRPPGHHATHARGMGFCLINNAAAAAEHLIQQEGAERLAILDLDLHHGNGTQDIFYARPDVFYLSTHQAPLYPGTGRIYEKGRGPGSGTNANIPLPPSSGDQAFQEAVDRIVLPLLERFDPQMLLVSYGFDTHWMDPLGSLLLSAGGYAALVASLADFADRRCGGRIALILEGGYDLSAAAACSTGAAAALLGQEWSDPLGESPYEESSAWQGVFDQIAELWGLEDG